MQCKFQCEGRELCRSTKLNVWPSRSLASIRFSIPPSSPQANRAQFLDTLGHALADAGVTLLEYRNKAAADAEILADSEILRRALPSAKLILDDRADLVAETGFDGVHVDAATSPLPKPARFSAGAHHRNLWRSR